MPHQQNQKETKNPKPEKQKTQRRMKSSMLC